MKHFLIFVEGVAGWIECYAADKAAARAYAREALGLRQLPRHCVVPA
jgi:hypothetical protein